MKDKITTDYLQIKLPGWFKRSLKKSAEEKGIPMARYIRDAVKEKQEREKQHQNSIK